MTKGRGIPAVLVLLLVSSFSGCHTDDPEPIRSTVDLDGQAVLQFAIFSDNKGESPLSSVEFARMVDWIGAGDAAFVVGLGDHLKNGWENSFIPWIQSDPWWREHTYLNVADGENEYFSPTHKQSDYGAGAPILDLVDLEAHAGVIRPNSSEYYARIQVGGFTVHLIQLHFSDQPRDDDLAFPEENRSWLIETLDGIDKGERDLVIVAAHSRAGSWDMVLSPERRRKLLGKADLVLSATTHRYQSWVPEGFEASPAVCVNTGAVNFPGHMTPNGYVEIHVLKSGAIAGQYIDLTQTERKLQRGRFAWIKPKDGPMRHTDFRPAAAGENMDEQVASMVDSLDRDAIERGLTDLLKRKTGADLAFAGASNGFSQGPVTRGDAWKVFNKNKNYRVVRVPAARIDTVLARYDLPPLMDRRDPVRIAAPQSMATTIIGFTGLTYEALEPQRVDESGLRQVGLLMEWLKGR
jgi:hypothetical protein